MEENIQKEDDISLMDILHLLLSKIKLLLLVVIIGGLLGGSFAIWRTIDVKYYGTEVQFYVNPDRPKKTTVSESSQYGVYGAYGRHVMDNMVKLLSSESFTEHLILNGKTIPDPSTAENPWLINVKGATEVENAAASQEFNNALNKALADTTELINQANAAKKTYSDAQKDANVELESLQEAWKAEVPSIDGVSSSYWTYSELAFNHLQNRLSPELKELCEHYQKTTKPQVDSLQEASDAAVKVAEDKTEDTLSQWRKTVQYRTELARYSGCVSYSYLEENADADDANNLARSFIYVKISILNDKNLAEELYDRVIEVVPTYVEANMAVPSDYEGTKCMRISRTDEIRLTNVNYTKSQAIKYAVLFAAAAAVIAAVVIIIADRSDKRLRDPETIMKLFNVPVLGIVPTINDLTEKSIAKKRENAKRKQLAKKKKAVTPAQQNAPVKNQAQDNKKNNKDRR